MRVAVSDRRKELAGVGGHERERDRADHVPQKVLQVLVQVLKDLVGGLADGLAGNGDESKLLSACQQPSDFGKDGGSVGKYYHAAFLTHTTHTPMSAYKVQALWRVNDVAESHNVGMIEF